MNVINFEDGQCKRIRSYLDSYLNNELMVETNHEVITHLEICAACATSLKDRERVKAQLKRAVMQEYAPVALRERIEKDLRQRRGFRLNLKTFSIVLLAAAASAVIAAVTFTYVTSRTSSPSKKPLSIQAQVAPGDVSGSVLKIGFDDHVFCAIDHKLANIQFTPEQMSEKLGPEYAALVAMVEEKMPKDYTVAVGHRCHYQGREFIHLIMRNQDNAVSLVITHKNGEAFPAGGSTAVVEASGIPVYQMGSESLQVSGIETRDFLAFIVSNQTKDENASIASSLAPSIHRFLTRLES